MDKKVSELLETIELNDEDILMILQSGQNKKIKAINVFKNINELLSNLENAKAEKTVVNAIESRVATLEESSTQSTVLYERSSGNTGIIELSDSVSNYSCIEIVFKNNDDLYSSQRFIDCNFKNIVLQSINPVNDSGNCYIKSTNILVSDDVLRPVKYSEVSLYTAGNLKISSTDNRLSIVKVIGWK